MKKLLFLAALLIGISACHDPQPGPELLEAKNLQDEMLIQHKSLGDAVALKKEACQMMLSNAEEQNDSLKVLLLTKAEDKISAIENKLEAWDKELVLIPGYEHHHEDGEECTHDHATEQLLKGMSEADILAIQKELQGKIVLISEEIKSLEIK